MMVEVSFSLTWSHPVMEDQASSSFLGQIKFYVHIVWRDIYDRIIRTSRPLATCFGVAVCNPQALWLREIDNELFRVGRVARALYDLQWRGMVLYARSQCLGITVLKADCKTRQQACEFCLVLHSDLKGSSHGSWATWTLSHRFSDGSN